MLFMKLRKAVPEVLRMSLGRKRREGLKLCHGISICQILWFLDFDGSKKGFDHGHFKRSRGKES